MIVAQRGRPLHSARNEYGKQIRKMYENGQIHEKRSNIQHLELRDDGICNTITTVLKDNLVIRNVKMKEKVVLEDIQPLCKIYSYTDKVDTDQTKTIEDYLYAASDGEQYGIFKLSPRECGRLMDVSDRDIDRMFSVNSNSQCYKQFGNSIVVNVLVAIFGQLFEGKEGFYKQGGLIQAGKDTRE